MEETAADVVSVFFGNHTYSELNLTFSLYRAWSKLTDFFVPNNHQTLQIKYLNMAVTIIKYRSRNKLSRNYKF